MLPERSHGFAVGDLSHAVDPDPLSCMSMTSFSYEIAALTVMFDSTTFHAASTATPFCILPFQMILALASMLSGMLPMLFASCVASSATSAYTSTTPSVSFMSNDSAGNVASEPPDAIGFFAPEATTLLGVGAFSSSDVMPAVPSSSTKLCASPSMRFPVSSDDFAFLNVARTWSVLIVNP